MAGDNSAAPPAVEQLRHRFMAVCIEIVGGLIQQQQVRRLDQQARQRGAGSFTAAERSQPAIRRQGG
jgi:sulfite reductase beta subunit-like hemoprotein